MAFKPRTQEAAEALNNTPADQLWQRAVNYLKHHTETPSGDIVQVNPEQACLGANCDCMRNPNKALQTRMEQGRLKQPLSRAELTLKEKKLLMDAPESTGIYYDALPLV